MTAPAKQATLAPLAAQSRRQRRILLILLVAAVGLVIAFCTFKITGNWEYAVRLRSRKVAAMIVVGAAIAYSSVLFQTVTNNRILTPSIMGFDALFVLIQTAIVYFLGTLTLAQIDPRLMFIGQVLVMVVFASALYRWLFGKQSQDLYVLVLVGVVFGAFFSSLSALGARLIDPNDFITLQDRFFASFNSVNTQLLAFSAVVMVAVGLWGLRLFRKLDVIALGREHAVNLGVDYRRVVNQSLVIIAILVSISTALVGPITFLGLLVANLARQMTGTFRHWISVPAAMLIAIVTLVGGQLILEHVFALNTALSVIINFVGGVYFIVLLIRESRK
ncbi:iron chelate uptake ABC transporter family permease subunit [Tomitella biformata]|uniref:iron chelate uptake ABC transporter family permease subunit n=1 Tax=Tomitella biformata TaxID=630403 RepID=UPI0004B9F05F|nr:iron chelate uptake ABC transporter family permease subunit [Tomitella biformata]